MDNSMQPKVLKPNQRTRGHLWDVRVKESKKSIKAAQSIQYTIFFHIAPRGETLYENTLILVLLHHLTKVFCSLYLG